MASYSNSATVIREDGMEFPVTANLRAFKSGLRSDWSGRLSATPAALEGLLNTQGGRLRLADGTEAPVHFTDTSTVAVFGYLDVTGEGEPPF